jgi:hypothetical protein
MRQIKCQVLAHGRICSPLDHLGVDHPLAFISGRAFSSLATISPLFDFNQITVDEVPPIIDRVCASARHDQEMEAPAHCPDREAEDNGGLMSTFQYCCFVQ